MDENLRAELLRRAAVDQTARNALDPEAMEQADAQNLPWLKEMIADHGWPGRSAVGEDGAAAAWLLVQHADRDPAFQRECLGLLTAAADADEATKAHVAYLTDRVLLAEGHPQEYGTQVTGRDRQWVPRSLRDPDRVDERRAQMMLGPLADYLAHFAEQGQPPPISIRCPHCGERVDFWPPDTGDESAAECGGCRREIRIRLESPA